jgi:hypothetical protein
MRVPLARPPDVSSGSSLICCSGGVRETEMPDSSVSLTQLKEHLPGRAWARQMCTVFVLWTRRPRSGWAWPSQNEASFDRVCRLSLECYEPTPYTTACEVDQLDGHIARSTDPQMHVHWVRPFRRYAAAPGPALLVVIRFDQRSKVQPLPGCPHPVPCYVDAN